ncbi:hypothetical protein [Falsiroseomonas selenitidurans]|uniref:Regulatory protein RecX n=1 Tax=Falsiroseomonas selenitidurans TaxID=2716335 RepID=A0ABX1EBJ8_9PROT|nr:hypothetical protein [Falsiroseomonas selenitidurans]NKC32290.1 hypothetical protein [Falsiroseomonas selenitidurans]
MHATDQDGRARFGELIKLQMQGRRFLDRAEERRLLEEGLTRYGLRLDEAAGLLRAAAEQDQVALEGELGRSSGLLLKTMADARGRVARQDFAKAVAFYRARAGAELTEAEAARAVKRRMEELELQPKPHGRLIRTRRWYRAIAE